MSDPNVTDNRYNSLNRTPNDLSRTRNAIEFYSSGQSKSYKGMNGACYCYEKNSERTLESITKLENIKSKRLQAII